MSNIDNNIMSNFQSAKKTELEIMNYIAKALVELITADDSTLDLKTETNEPKELALLKEWSKYANDEWLSFVKNESEREDKLSGLIKRFYTNYERLMFSLDRKSRNEIVQCITAFLIREKEKTDNDSNDLSNLVKK